MLSETLTYAECERFYDIRDSLVVFANQYFDLDNEVFFDPDDQLSFNEQAVNETLRYVWDDTTVIDAFVTANPSNLSLSDLAIVASWKNVLRDYFLVFEHVNKILLVNSNRIFHVTGLIEPLRDVLGYEEPMMVKFALLPFNDKLVYDGFALMMPMQLGPGAKRMFADEIARALKSGEHITTGEQFIQVVPAVKEERVKREAEEMLRDLEMEEKAQQQLEGHHKGVLAGMSPDERERTVVNYIHEASPLRQFDFVAELMKDCTKGPIDYDLESLLMLEKKEILRRRCILLGMPHQTRLTKADLAAEIAYAINVIDTLQAITLQSLTPNQFANYRSLFEAGGVRSVKAEELSSFAGLPPVMPMFCYLFFNGGEFTYVIPDQMLDALERFNWERTEGIVRDFDRAANIADALVSLRGIVTMREAYDEFARCYPDAFGELDFEMGVYDAVADQVIGCYIVQAEDATYIVHYEIGEIIREEMHIARDEAADGVLVGDLGSMDYILEARKGKAARTLDEGIRSSSDWFDWCLNKPAVRALRDYLDAHVPDDANDYTFAESVIEELIDFMAFGMMGITTIETCFEILAHYGLMLNEAHMGKVMDLLMNMSNSMPTWMNNGWAANELHEVATGRKVFYNEDGSVKKIGRNEPCPCGSGKKYKKCCGR